MFELTGIGKDFVNKTMIAQALRPKINKWDLMKLNFLNSKGYNQVKRQPTEWEEILSELYLWQFD